MLPLLNENWVFFDYLSGHLLPLSLVYSTDRLVYGMDNQGNRAWIPGRQRRLLILWRLVSSAVPPSLILYSMGDVVPSAWLKSTCHCLYLAVNLRKGGV